MPKKRKIPVDTQNFTYYNANPKGKMTTDCVTRAITTALNQPYETTVRELTELWLKTGYEMTEPRCYGKYLESKGFEKQKQPRKADNTRYTGREFVRIFKGVCVANIGSSHVVCIKDGKVIDIWNSTGGCIGNYWIKKGADLL